MDSLMRFSLRDITVPSSFRSVSSPIATMIMLTSPPYSSLAACSFFMLSASPVDLLSINTTSTRFTPGLLGLLSKASLTSCKATFSLGLPGGSRTRLMMDMRSLSLRF